MENHCFAEADVGDEDDDPCDKARDCGNVGEPVEYCGAIAADVQESQTSDGESEENGNPRYTVLIATKENLWCLISQSERVKHS